MAMLMRRLRRAAGPSPVSAGWGGVSRACRRASGSAARGGAGGGAVALEYLRVRGGDARGWARAGFRVTADGRVRVGGVALDVLDDDVLCDAHADGPAAGVDLLGFRNLPDGVRAIHGSIPVVRRDGGDGGLDAGATGGPTHPTHPNGVHRVDHVVVKTSDLDRTEDALTRELGLTLRRRGAFGGTRMLWFREPGRPDAPIVEVVEEVAEAGGHGAAGASPSPHTYLWGIAVVADDLAAAVAHAPAAAFSPIRAAKQPGRWICTARHDVLELGLQVALMSPHVPPS